MRCEAAGDAYAASKAAHDAAVSEYETMRASITARLMEDGRLAQLEAQLADAVAERSEAWYAAGDVFDAAMEEERARPEREFDAEIRGRASERADVKAANARYSEARRLADELDAAMWALRDEEIPQTVARETSTLRAQVEQLERQVRLDSELLGRTINEANALREPGGPICSWQFE